METILASLARSDDTPPVSWRRRPKGSDEMVVVAYLTDHCAAPESVIAKELPGSLVPEGDSAVRQYEDKAGIPVMQPTAM